MNEKLYIITKTDNKAGVEHYLRSDDRYTLNLFSAAKYSLKTAKKVLEKEQNKLSKFWAERLTVGLKEIIGEDEKFEELAKTAAQQYDTIIFKEGNLITITIKFNDIPHSFNLAADIYYKERIRTLSEEFDAEEFAVKKRNENRDIADSPSLREFLDLGDHIKYTLGELAKITQE